MNQDALERLRNRAKPTVQSRDLSTIPLVSESPPELNSEVSKSQNNKELSEREASITLDGAIDISNSSNQDIKISTTTDAEVTSQPSSSARMDIKTKQSTIRLEQKLSQRLTQQCQDEEISREVFLEALFVYFENHKSIQKKVLQEARQRDKFRQKIANYRRAKSMIERFSN